ncbi:MAG: (2Fe-2S) ferredoxin domain-containing protein [Candidatus Omnitrophica bacterium]|nr:(2Fe-2S) ferredoxin domain-containing protein [Candidatus Omnitrophota bacterium]
MQERKSPYVCHVFVCTNDRAGVRKSCADGASVTLHRQLKERIASAGLQELVRVSSTACQGQCEHGPNVMIYPQGIWFSDATPNNSDEIIGKIEFLLTQQRESAT